MNQISAKVTKIETFENITIVSFLAFGESLKMMSLEMSKNLQIGSIVTLGVKASSVSLAKNLESALSISNQLRVSIQEVNNGTLLASVKLRFGEAFLESIITLESSKRLGLVKNETLIALIKSSDLSILEIVS